jgi:hypothetical protein
MLIWLALIPESLTVITGLLVSINAFIYINGIIPQFQDKVNKLKWKSASPGYYFRRFSFWKLTRTPSGLLLGYNQKNWKLWYILQTKDPIWNIH